MQLTVRNVNHAFYELVSGIDSGKIPTVRRPSRVGEILQIPEPLLLTYTHPREKVLLNPARDCNPFFHLYESLWMLAGRNDVAPLACYNSRMPEFSDDGSTFHGAYGYRWRKWFGFDQLDAIVDELRKDPNSRRCVLQMWDSTVEPPHTIECSDPYMAVNGGKDVPCNTQAYFSVRRECVTLPDYHDQTDGSYAEYLDMTVCNRSNDIVWGMLGANAVHFAILQEYLAARIGVEVGVYNQFTNNAHVYTERFTPEKWLDGWEPSYPIYKKRDMDIPQEELEQFVADQSASDCTGEYNHPFLEHVAKPMCWAFHAHKERNGMAVGIADTIASLDWREAAITWLCRRAK